MKAFSQIRKKLGGGGGGEVVVGRGDCHLRKKKTTWGRTQEQGPLAMHLPLCIPRLDNCHLCCLYGSASSHTHGILL